MGEIFQQAISLTGNFNLWLILIIFASNMVGEFGVSIPYLMETIWLLVGYHLMGGTISPGAILICCSISLIGRETGALLLYKISGYGRSPLLKALHAIIDDDPCATQPMKFIRRRILTPLVGLMTKVMSSHAAHQTAGDDSAKLAKSKPFCPSTFNVVLGRFSWLKIPITINLGIVKKASRLILGVGFFSLAWDGLYISLGVFGAGSKVNSTTMLIGTIGTFITINGIIYLIRRYRANRRQRLANIA